MNTTTQPTSAQLGQADHRRAHRLASFLRSTPSPKPKTSTRWRGVFFGGPEPEQDPEGEEIPVWFVFVGDEEAAPLGTVYKCRSFGIGESLAKRMAKDRKLELIQEAMPA